MASKVLLPIVSKVYCSPSEVVLAVRRRPNVANGGGFVVVDCNQGLVFSVEGCGILGRKEEMLLRDVEALSLTRKWKGFTYDILGSLNKLVFTLKQPNSCFSDKTPIRIAIATESKEWFEVQGDFPGRSCSIVSSRGDVVALIGVERELQQVMRSRDLYHVKIKPGFDQAFVFGVIAVLDYIYDGSTRC
ncbi:hypothetical protein ACS0TY_023157 [Phlomoides rotata]